MKKVFEVISQYDIRLNSSEKGILKKYNATDPWVTNDLVYIESWKEKRLALQLSVHVNLPGGKHLAIVNGNRVANEAAGFRSHEEVWQILERIYRKEVLRQK